ncbi:MAG: hypothetical protein ACK52I_01555 [Pseudomonadota bacterium]|jgi:hypothetical protein
MEIAVIVGLVIQVVIEILVIVWLAQTAAASQKTAARMESIYKVASDLETLRAVLVDAARDVRHRRSEQFYDESLIPSDKFYVRKRDVAKRIMKAKLATAQQIEEARVETSFRGGHFCDHLIAFGVVDAEALAEALLDGGAA